MRIPTVFMTEGSLVFRKTIANADHQVVPNAMTAQPVDLDLQDSFSRLS